MTLKSSLKVIQTGSIRKLAYGFLFAFHSNYGRIDNRLWDIQRQTWKLDLEHDLENWVRGCLRLLKTAAFDTSHTTFYWSVIVNIALSCTVFELFDIEWYHDIEISVRGHSRSFKPVPFESLGSVSCAPSIVTMALSCIIYEKKRDIGRKLWFFHTPLHSSSPLGRGGVPSEYCHPVWYGKTRMVGLPTVKKLWGYV